MQVIPLQTANQAIPDSGVNLEQLAHRLAENHTGVTKSRQSRTLLIKHLPKWKQTLQDAYQHFRATSLKDPVFSQASEWMLDNFYIVEQTFHQIEEDLPKSYFDQLPKLDATTLRRYPRIFALAWELVGYGQGQLDLSQATAFVQDYQQVTPLTVGELWALPTMLRIGILEHLTAAVAVITGIDGPGGLVAQPILPIPPALPNEAIVANCFLSLRLLSATDWKGFFEQTSRIEQILRLDPAGIYATMDFDTRNTYRSVVEELARNSSQSEETVARSAIEFARKAQDQPHASPQNPGPKNPRRLFSDRCGSFHAGKKHRLPAAAANPAEALGPRPSYD